MYCSSALISHRQQYKEHDMAPNATVTYLNKITISTWYMNGSIIKLLIADFPQLHPLGGSMYTQHTASGSKHVEVY